MTFANNDHYVLEAAQPRLVEVEQLRYSQLLFFIVQRNYFTHSYTGQILKAAKTFTDAGAGDPLLLYVRNVRISEYFSTWYLVGTDFDDDLQNRRRTLLERIGERVRTAAFVALCIRTKVVLAVNGGTSTLIAWVIIILPISLYSSSITYRTPPHGQSGGRKDPLARLAKRIAKALSRLTRKVIHKDPEEERVSLR